MTINFLPFRKEYLGQALQNLTKYGNDSVVAFVLYFSECII